MSITRQVVSTLQGDGTDVMGPDVLAWHYPDQSLVSGSLLTVEANHFAVLKSRGAVLDTYETGQYPIQTPDKPVLGSFVQGFFGGQSPWQYEVLYVKIGGAVRYRLRDVEGFEANCRISTLDAS